MHFWRKFFNFFFPNKRTTNCQIPALFNRALRSLHLYIDSSRWQYCVTLNPSVLQVVKSQKWWNSRDSAGCWCHWPPACCHSTAPCWWSRWWRLSSRCSRLWRPSPTPRHCARQPEGWHRRTCPLCRSWFVGCPSFGQKAGTCQDLIKDQRSSVSLLVLTMGSTVTTAKQHLHTDNWNPYMSHLIRQFHIMCFREKPWMLRKRASF